MLSIRQHFLLLCRYFVNVRLLAVHFPAGICAGEWPSVGKRTIFYKNINFQTTEHKNAKADHYLHVNIVLIKYTNLLCSTLLKRSIPPSRGLCGSPIYFLSFTMPWQFHRRGRLSSYLSIHLLASHEDFLRRSSRFSQPLCLPEVAADFCKMRFSLLGKRIVMLVHQRNFLMRCPY